jgi:tetraacyldisaccharide 4'-kinase
MDDGFQHRYLHRNLDIVVLDSRKDLSRTPMIPAGERRELMSAIKRAHLVALSRSDEDSGWWKNNPDCLARPVIRYRYKIDCVMRLGPDGQRSLATIVKEKLFAFSGIGDHLEFVRQMRDANFPIIGDMRFPDHHQYTAEDLNRVQSSAAERGSGTLLTTEKDAARLSANMKLLNNVLQRFSLFSVGIVVDIVEGREILDSMIDACLSRRAA